MVQNVLLAKNRSPVDNVNTVGEIAVEVAG